MVYIDSLYSQPIYLSNLLATGTVDKVASYEHLFFLPVDLRVVELQPYKFENKVLLTKA